MALAKGGAGGGGQRLTLAQQLAQLDDPTPIGAYTLRCFPELGLGVSLRFEVVLEGLTSPPWNVFFRISNATDFDPEDEGRQHDAEYAPMGGIEEARAEYVQVG
jgi:hypothetical protein